MTPREAMLKALELAMTEKELMYALNVARQIFETFGKSEKLDELMQRILKDAETQRNGFILMSAAGLYSEMAASEVTSA